jgi:RimJ/RimL family protein N-acetyltransferase
MSVQLRPVSRAAADEVLAGRRPAGVQVAADYPTEFSTGIAAQADGGSPLGPFFLHRCDDDVVVGEIGGGFVEPSVVEIGYAIVASCWGRGYATDAVQQLVGRARTIPEIKRMVGHAPLDRPASGRVLHRAGFVLVGEETDEHEGVAMRVQRWELVL